MAKGEVEVRETWTPAYVSSGDLGELRALREPSSQKSLTRADKKLAIAVHSDFSCRKIRFIRGEQRGVG